MSEYNYASVIKGLKYRFEQRLPDTTVSLLRDDFDILCHRIETLESDLKNPKPLRMQIIYVKANEHYELHLVDVNDNGFIKIDAAGARTSHNESSAIKRLQGCGINFGKMLGLCVEFIPMKANATMDGSPVWVVTDDGSMGVKGNVIDLLDLVYPNEGESDGINNRTD